MANLESSDCQNSDQRNFLNENSVEFCSTGENYSIQTLMEEMNLVVTEKYEFEYRDKAIITKTFNFWYYPDFDTKE